MIKNNMLLKLTLCLFVCLYASSNHALMDSKNNADRRIQVGSSYYLIDKALVVKGYDLKKINNNMSVLYKNKIIPVVDLYMSSMGPDEAIKLFIELANTLKNARVSLNGTPLTTTDDNGMAVIDRYKKTGTYLLKITNKKQSLNYFFSLTEGLRIVCSGIDNFKCDKTKYH